MKENPKGHLFSISENEYFDDKQSKIELVSCDLGGHKCSEHRAVINRKMLASRKFLLNKDYLRSIESIKEAYYITADLQENSCANCAKLFRCMLTQSLENIHDDLKQMSRGWFMTKRYQSSYKLATLVLEEFRKDC